MFKDGATVLGSGSLNGSGQASYSTTTLAAGAHTITAVYNADGNCSGSTSAPITQTVNSSSSVGGTAATALSPICYNSSTTISLSGHVGSIVKWQFSTNSGANWTDIASTANPLPTGNLTRTTQFRAVVQYATATPANSTIAEVDIETTPPTITTCATNRTGILGAPLPDFTTSMVASDNCGGAVAKSQNPLAGTIVSTIGSYPVTLTATDAASNSANCFATYTTKYQPASSACTFNGSPGHVILQPVNVDGTSVFKQGSTAPAKFMVLDANCNSVGTPGVVSSFNLVQIISGTMVANVDETVDSTTPDNAFRWDPSGQQWIFNISTKSLAKNKTYVYLITLNDGSTIQFQFGLR